MDTLTPTGPTGTLNCMAAVAPLPPRRTLFVDERGTGLRVSWHAERNLVVLSLWSDDVCTGSFRLPVAEAARLAAFLVHHLGHLATEAAETAEVAEMAADAADAPT